MDTKFSENRDMDVDMDTKFLKNRDMDVDLDTRFLKNRDTDVDMDTRGHRCPPTSDMKFFSLVVTLWFSLYYCIRATDPNDTPGLKPSPPP